MIQIKWNYIIQIKWIFQKQQITFYFYVSGKLSRKVVDNIVLLKKKPPNTIKQCGNGKGISSDLFYWLFYIENLSTS